MVGSRKSRPERGIFKCTDAEGSAMNPNLVTMALLGCLAICLGLFGLMCLVAGAIVTLILRQLYALLNSWFKLDQRLRRDMGRPSINPCESDGPDV